MAFTDGLLHFRMSSKRGLDGEFINTFYEGPPRLCVAPFIVGWNP